MFLKKSGGSAHDERDEGEGKPALSLSLSLLLELLAKQLKTFAPLFPLTRDVSLSPLRPSLSLPLPLVLAGKGTLCQLVHRAGSEGFER